MSNEYSGEIFKRPSDCEACRSLLARIEMITHETSKQQSDIVRLLDEKLDTLIQAVAKPIDTFRWIMIGLLLLLFAKDLGVAGLKELGGLASKTAVVGR